VVVRDCGILGFLLFTFCWICDWQELNPFYILYIPVFPPSFQENWTGVGAEDFLRTSLPSAKVYQMLRKTYLNLKSPVTTTNLFSGMAKLSFWRLFTRAFLMMMYFLDRGIDVDFGDRVLQIIAGNLQNDRAKREKKLYFSWQMEICKRSSIKKSLKHIFKIFLSEKKEKALLFLMVFVL